MTEVVSTVVSFIMLVMGLSYFYHSAYWVRFIQEATKQPYRYFPMAFFVFSLGLIIITTHNIWVPDWPVVITLFGWLMTLEGVLFLVFPHSIRPAADRTDSFLLAYIRGVGAVMTILGLLLVIRHTIVE